MSTGYIFFSSLAAAFCTNWRQAMGMLVKSELQKSRRGPN